ncbi:MAG: hypothetical protein EOP32_11980 [Rhodococcus sp. (in: high G+C Gram-positive bacteria)]|nr:MAG: hypothetical protein EOP32_11980 [Rhodococcus sp. (in: high G+C Gram-positive bacteria)]
MGKQCYEPGFDPRPGLMLEGGTWFNCDGGEGCTLDHGGDVPKLRDGGPVSKAAFNPVTKPAWEIASRTMPEVLLPVATGVTIADGLLEG